MNHDEMIAVIQHHKNGGKVQSRSKSPRGLEWADIKDPLWNFDGREYRIKPEPIEAWCMVDKSTGLKYLYFSKEEAQNARAMNEVWSDRPISDYLIVKLREVEDE